MPFTEKLITTGFLSFTTEQASKKGVVVVTLFP